MAFNSRFFPKTAPYGPPQILVTLVLHCLPTLGYAYMLAGRVSEALPLLEQSARWRPWKS